MRNGVKNIQAAAYNSAYLYGRWHGRSMKNCNHKIQWQSTFDKPEWFDGTGHIFQETEFSKSDTVSNFNLSAPYRASKAPSIWNVCFFTVVIR